MTDKFKNRKYLIVALLVLTLGVSGFVWAQNKVDVIADGKKVTITTIRKNPGDIIAQAGFSVGVLDEYRLSTARVVDGTVITVHRAVPVVIYYKGKEELVMTAKPTVGEVAIAFNMDKPNVRIEPSPETCVTEEMKIRGITLTEEVLEVELTAPHTIIRQPDSGMEKGEERISQYGVDGTKKALVKRIYEDDKHVSDITLEEKILKEPVSGIIMVGTRDVVETSRGNMRFRRIETMEASAYLPGDGNGQGVTATGLQARYGIVAVDPSFIPLGSRLFIPGYGLALAADTGGYIRGNRIDLCMEDAGSAWSFGRRSVKVYILD